MKNVVEQRRKNFKSFKTGCNRLYNLIVDPFFPKSILIKNFNTENCNSYQFQILSDIRSW